MVYEYKHCFNKLTTIPNPIIMCANADLLCCKAVRTSLADGVNSKQTDEEAMYDIYDFT